MTIGQYGALTVEQARKIAKQTLADVAKGADPALDRAAAKGAPTIGELGKEYLDDVRSRRKPTTAREYARLWKKHVAPNMSSIRVAKAATADVSRLHRSLKAKPYLANRVVALLGSFFTYAERQGLRAKHSNPARDVEPFVESSRERFLTADEVSRLGAALTRAKRTGLPVPGSLKARKRGMSAKRRAKLTGRKRGPYKRNGKEARTTPASPFAVSAIRFLLLTGWREREALTLKWSDVDLARGVAVLPDTKTGRSPRVLGAPARLLLDELPRIEGSPYVFPGRDARKPLVEINRVWYAVREVAELNDVRLHDLRHSFASVSASSGASLLMIGRLLGHRDTATTAKYAHLLEDPVRETADRAAQTLNEWLGKQEESDHASKPVRIA
jgi:integrase